MAKKLILVTGGAGHVGSHVIEQLSKNPENRIISLDSYFTGTAANHIPGVDYRVGSTKQIHALVPETPDIVYHLGEYARIAPSFDDVATVYDMNIVGTFEVVEFCRLRSVGKLVYTASSTKFAVEGNGRNQNPYSFTKATNVDLITNYGRWYDLPYAICYLYNAFGPRENGTGPYATLIAKYEQDYLAGSPLIVHGDGTQKRHFTYVGDLARGIILVGENGMGDGYQLASSESFSVNDIALAFGGPIEHSDVYSGRSDSDAQSEKARTELGWDTTVTVIEYIHSFIERESIHRSS